MSSHLPKHAVDRLLSIGAETDDDEPPGLAGLGRYRLLRELGRGGMGRVYEAVDTQLDRKVALKLMPETVGLSEVMRRRFVREAQAVAKLSHPNIAAVFDATPDYIAMQLVAGCSIIDVPRDDPRLLAGLIRDAALAVECAHEHGIVHRDLKPSNLMVEMPRTGGDTTSTVGAPRVFVLDFGLAKETSIESSLSTSGSIVGTPAYMPPEQAEGRGQDVDERSDVYSLGATLYACLTGDAPFPGDDMLAVLRRVVDEDARSPRIESDLDAIVLKCLSKEPERRYARARDLADDLTRWLDGQPVVAKPPSLAYRLRKFAARRRALLRAVAIAFGLSAVIAGAILFQIRRELDSANLALRFSSRMETALTNAIVLMRVGEKGEADMKLDGAILECEGFLRQFDTAAHVHYLHGRLLRELGKSTRAAAALDRAIELDPEHAAARLERSLLLLDRYAREVDLGALMGDVSPQAADILRQARADLELATDVKEDLRLIDRDFASAELSRLDGNLTLARDQLENVIARDPAHSAAHTSLSRLYFALGDAEKGRQYAQAAVDLSAGFAPAFLAGAGKSEDEAPSVVVGEPTLVDGIEEVLSDFTGSMLRDATATVARLDARIERMREAAALTASGDTERAEKVWQDVIVDFDGLVASAPRLVGARLNRAVCRTQLERVLLARGRNLDAVAIYRGAMLDYDEVIRAAPSFGAARFDRALLRHHQAERLAAFGRFVPASVEAEQAVDDFAKAIELGWTPPAVYRERARSRELWSRILGALGKTAEADAERASAVSDLEEALRQLPGQSAARVEWQAALEALGG